MEDRTRALIFLHEYHTKGRGAEHTKEVKRAYLALREIAYPPTAEIPEQKMESMPSDASKGRSTPLSNLDPKNYW